MDNAKREAEAVRAGNLLPYEGLLPPYEVWAAMVACGIDRTLDEHKDVAVGLFQDEYETCLDLNDKSLHNYHKAAAEQGGSHRITHTVMQRNNIRAFVQWTKDNIRTGKDPGMLKFEPKGISKILKKAKTHEIYVDNSSVMAVKPKDFTKDIKWSDWSPTFQNYLRAIPGRIGTPLSYVIRENDLPNPTPNEDFLDDYIMNSSLTGLDYLMDRRVVHTKLVALISSNPDAESLIKLNEKEANGRKSWQDLKLHYEGKGMYGYDIKSAKDILRNLTYKGENPPKESWDKFERQINTAFSTFVKVYNREVYCNEMKLAHIVDAVQCPKMSAVSAAINVAITSGSTLYTYEYAMASYKAEVSKLKGADPNHRDINEVKRPWVRGGGFGRGRFTSGRGRESGGRGNYSGRGNYIGNKYQQVPKTIDGSVFFNLIDGTRIEYHPDLKYSPEIYSKFTNDQKIHVNL